MPLNLTRSLRYQRISVIRPLLTGDLLLLYTDGLVEQRRRDLYEGFALLTKAAAGAPLPDDGPNPDGVVAHVLAALEAPNSHDDACLVAIRVL
jgi:serine phosphatase RsbU (regulator of sigma subunit)